jgi:hypothetical protein
MMMMMMKKKKKKRKKSHLLGSQLKQWKLLEECVIVSLHRKKKAHIAMYDSVESNLVY